MNLTVNGQSQVPPGFRFHPTEEELLLYYLKKKVANQKIDLDVIQDVDLNKLEPWDIQEKCRIGSSAQNDWYFFSHKDKKYPTGTRTNRATAAGFWKATGRDKVIRSSSRRIGMRKTLVFYMGRAPHGEKSDWIMHEYRLDDITPVHDVSSSGGDQCSVMEEGWVVCRVFKKKNYVKALDSPPCRSSLQPIDHKTVLSSMTHDLDHILSYMGKTNTTTTTTTINNNNKTAGIRYVASSTSLTNMDQVVQERFQHLPQLESPTHHVPEPQPFDPDGSSSINSAYPPNNDHHQLMFDCASYKPNWVELDRLVAYQLNGESTVEASESARRLSYINSTFHPTNHSTTMPFCLTDDNDGSDEHTASPTASFQQLLLSQSSPAYDSETAEDQLYWSFTRPSSASSPSLDLIHHSSA